MNRPSKKIRPTGHVRDFESDLDHRDKLEALPPGYTEALPIQSEIPGMARAALRAHLHDIAERDIVEKHGVGTPMAGALLRKLKDEYNARPPVSPSDYQVASSSDARRSEPSEHISDTSPYWDPQMARAGDFVKRPGEDD